jgi:hypothetical protein
VTSADVRLDGRFVRLRAVEPSDYPALRRAEVASPIALRWRLGGQHVPPEMYADSLWHGVLACFIFGGTTAESPGGGMVSAYGADPRHGFCYMSAARFSSFGGELRDALCTVEAIALFVDFLFQGWPFRKIYFECAEYNTPQFASFLDRCREEGQLHEHLYLDDRYWDLGTWSVSRSAWPEIRALLNRDVEE